MFSLRSWEPILLVYRRVGSSLARREDSLPSLNGTITIKTKQSGNPLASGQCRACEKVEKHDQESFGDARRQEQYKLTFATGKAQVHYGRDKTEVIKPWRRTKAIVRLHEVDPDTE